jgi:hypothetical protein
MTERYVVHHAPKSSEKIATQAFTGKGLAFAYAKRRLPNDHNGGISVQREVKQGASWKPTDAWTFFVDGHVDHVRL